MAKQILLTDNGVHREAKEGYMTVNGVYRKIKEGFVTVNGVYRSFMSSGLPFSDLPVGTLIKTNVNGVGTNFMIVHQGLPSSMYDSSCDGTWLMMKDIYQIRRWHTSGSNLYQSSNVNTYLNGDFIGLFDSGVQALIKQVKIPYVPITGTNGAVVSGASGLSVQVFLPSMFEVGYTLSTSASSTRTPADGSCLSYFSSGLHRDRVAYYNGSATAWWTRSPFTPDGTGAGTIGVWYVKTDGQSFFAYTPNESYGIRPTFILPNNITVNPTPNADGSYTLLA